MWLLWVKFRRASDAHRLNRPSQIATWYVIIILITCITAKKSLVSKVYPVPFYDSPTSNISEELRSSLSIAISKYFHPSPWLPENISLIRLFWLGSSLLMERCKLRIPILKQTTYNSQIHVLIHHKTRCLEFWHITGG